jgi:prophage tail gpP-like protein
MSIVLKIQTVQDVKTVKFWNNFEFDLAFNRVASTFSFSFYYDPKNRDHRIIADSVFQTVTVEHTPDGSNRPITLLTGMILSFSTVAKANKELMTITGYSLAGQLEDNNIPQTAYPLESNGLSLEAIATKLIQDFNFDLVVDPELIGVVNQKFKKSTAEPTSTIKDYLHEMAKQKDVWLSHDENGNLLMTKAKTGSVPIATFDLDDSTTTSEAYSFDLSANFQDMHRTITALKQASIGKGNAGQSTVNNPYVPDHIIRHKTVTQTSGDENDTLSVAKRELANELRGIGLTVEIHKWDIRNELILPNNTIDVRSKELNMFEKTRFFIESVKYVGDSKQVTCSLNCVLPEVYNQEEPKNIFKKIVSRPKF